MPFFVGGNPLKINIVRMLPKKQVSAILTFIKGKEKLLESGIFNRVLRDDIFRLLETQDCVVLYYPKENEENNGFHVEHPFRGELKHFVYINTAQLKETQIFAAAHELGHIWKIVEFMRECGFDGGDDWEEWIINRFAAELLMPEEEFKYFFNTEIEKLEEKYRHESIPVNYIIRVITAIMNEFLTPFKSVVHRLYELGIIYEKDAYLILEHYDNGVFKDYSEKVAREQGYSRLYQSPDKLKHIDNLREFLDKAREKDAMPEKWLVSMYELFDFEHDNTVDSSLSENISIFEGGNSNAKACGN